MLQKGFNVKHSLWHSTCPMPMAHPECLWGYLCRLPGMFFTLPVLLLSMRLLMHTLFTSLFPCWMKTPGGKAGLSAMDSTVVQLCDPHGYLQRNLSMMQSTPEVSDGTGSRVTHVS